jgi:hypothetical protein
MSFQSTLNRLRWLWLHRWTVLNVFLAAIPAGYALLPADWLPYIPPQIKAGLAIALLASIGMQAVNKIVPKDPPPP